MALSMPTRPAAATLALVFLVWTLAPVCGSATDIDPAACCSRHESCDASTPESGHREKPSDCCDTGEHSYPVAHLRVAPAAPAAVPAPAPDAVLDLAPSLTAVFEETGFPRAPLKIPRAPLYDLAHAYRI